MICGVTVLYKPSKEVFENIESYIYDLDKLYLIDNSEKKDEKLENKFINFSSKIEYIKMNGNEGIAKALNVAKNKAIEENYEWLLTMDQDSKFEKNDFSKMLSLVKINFSKETIIFSPFHKTVNKSPLNKKVVEKTRVMTSGNLLNLKLVREIGDFDNNLFIDEVDHDFCYRINRSGYKIKVFNEIILKHNLGNIKNYLFFFVTNHNYIRRYYITRNRLYMISKYPALKIEYMKLILKDGIKILLIEKDKIKKFKMIYLGIKDFKNNVTGKINQNYIK